MSDLVTSAVEAYVAVGIALGMVCAIATLAESWSDRLPHPLAVVLAWPLAFVLGLAVSAGVLCRWAFDTVFKND